MAYDLELADRIRELLGERNDVVEQAMFGGLAFMVGGHMAVAAGSRGALMVRVDPAETERLTAGDAAETMQMGGRPMTGWLSVGSTGVRTTRQLSRWVGIGLERVESLPPKKVKRRT